METENREGQTEFILRESRVLLAVRLMTIVLIGVFFILFFMVVSALFGPFIGTGSIVLLNFLFFIVLIFLGFLLAFFVTLKWRSEYYRIADDGLTKCRGILNKKEDKFSFSHVEGITLEQSFFGRMFDYGTVVIYDPSQKSKIYIVNIPDPRQNSVKIENALLKNRKAGVPIIAQPREQQII